MSFFPRTPTPKPRYVEMDAGAQGYTPEPIAPPAPSRPVITGIENFTSGLQRGFNESGVGKFLAGAMEKVQAPGNWFTKNVLGAKDPGEAGSPEYETAKLLKGRRDPNYVPTPQEIEQASIYQNAAIGFGFSPLLTRARVPVRVNPSPPALPAPHMPALPASRAPLALPPGPIVMPGAIAMSPPRIADRMNVMQRQLNAARATSPVATAPSFRSTRTPMERAVAAARAEREPVGSFTIHLSDYRAQNVPTGEFDFAIKAALPEIERAVADAGLKPRTLRGGTRMYTEDPVSPEIGIRGWRNEAGHLEREHDVVLSLPHATADQARYVGARLAETFRRADGLPQETFMVVRKDSSGADVLLDSYLPSMTPDQLSVLESAVTEFSPSGWHLTVMRESGEPVGIKIAMSGVDVETAAARESDLALMLQRHGIEPGEGLVHQATVEFHGRETYDRTIADFETTYARGRSQGFDVGQAARSPANAARKGVAGSATGPYRGEISTRSGTGLLGGSGHLSREGQAPLTPDRAERLLLRVAPNGYAGGLIRPERPRAR